MTDSASGLASVGAHCFEKEASSQTTFCRCYGETCASAPSSWRLIDDYVLRAATFTPVKVGLRWQRTPRQQRPKVHTPCRPSPRFSPDSDSDCRSLSPGRAVA